MHTGTECTDTDIDEQTNRKQVMYETLVYGYANDAPCAWYKQTGYDPIEYGRLLCNEQSLGRMYTEVSIHSTMMHTKYTTG